MIVALFEVLAYVIKSFMCPVCRKSSSCRGFFTINSRCHRLFIQTIQIKACLGIGGKDQARMELGAVSVSTANSKPAYYLVMDF